MEELQVTITRRSREPRRIRDAITLDSSRMCVCEHAKNGGFSCWQPIQQYARRASSVGSGSKSSERDGHSFTYKLDGGEEVVSVATASWKGDALVIDETTTYPNGRKHQTQRTLSLDANGMLRLEMSRTIDGKEQPPITVTYKKKPQDVLTTARRARAPGGSPSPRGAS